MYTGVCCSSHPKAEEEEKLPDIDQVFRVLLRHSKHEGNQFLFPEIDVEVYWTNLYAPLKPLSNSTMIGVTASSFIANLKEIWLLSESLPGRWT